MGRKPSVLNKLNGPNIIPPDILRQLESDEETFRKAEQNLDKVLESLDVSRAEAAEIDQSGIREQLKTLTEQFNNLTGRYRKKFKQLLVESLASAMIFGAGYAELNPVYGQNPVRSEYSSSMKTPERSPKYKIYTEQQIREGFPQDKQERVVVRSNVDDPNIFFELKQAGQRSGFIGFEDLDSFIKSRSDKVTEMEVDHTHPPESYIKLFQDLGYSSAEIDQFMKGEKPLPPQPPSMQDFVAEKTFEDYGASRGIEIKVRFLTPRENGFIILTTTVP